MLMLFLEVLKDLTKMFRYTKNMLKNQQFTFKSATIAKMKIPSAIATKSIKELQVNLARNLHYRYTCM